MKTKQQLENELAKRHGLPTGSCRIKMSVQTTRA